MKQIISKFWILVGLLILGIGANAQTNKKNIYVYPQIRNRPHKMTQRSKR